MRADELKRSAFIKIGALFVKKNISSGDSSETRTPSPAIEDVQANWQRVVRRRSFLQGIGMAVAAGLPPAQQVAHTGKGTFQNDAAHLRVALRQQSISESRWDTAHEHG